MNAEYLQNTILFGVGFHGCKIKTGTVLTLIVIFSISVTMCRPDFRYRLYETGQCGNGSRAAARTAECPTLARLLV